MAAPSAAASSGLQAVLRSFAFAVGVGLALGYVPATLYASFATDARYALIRKDVEAAQIPPISLESWQELPALRADAVARLESARTRIAITTFLVWALGAVAVAFVWNRQVIPKLSPLPPPGA